MIRKLAGAYMDARAFLLEHGYADEIDWQERVCVRDFTEADFLRETAWVILCSGMRERVIRSIFPAISDAFLHWRSAGTIVLTAADCSQRAQRYFRHSGKIAAIVRAAAYVADHGIEKIKRRLSSEGPPSLTELPYIGSVTSLHLAKNLGLPVAKPDRHLVRIAGAAGYPNVDALCRDIAEVTQHPPSVIDVVLWRFATLQPSYLDAFTVAADA